MDRRDFLKQVAVWSTGAAVAPMFDIRSIVAAEAAAAAKAQTVLSVMKGKDIAAMVAKAVEALGGISAFVKKDSRVVIKPNIGWDRKPEQAGNTNPEVVKAVVKLALDAGAKQVMVFDRTCNEARLTYVSSGIQAAVESVKDPRVQCIMIDMKKDAKKFVPVDIKDGKSINKFDFYASALENECDCYINVPVAKHHKSAILTMGLKNVMGVIGGNRADIHKSIHERIADLNLVVRPKLTILDATRILLRNGPQGGKMEDVKECDTIIASADTVAVDAYATRLFDKKPEDVGAIAAAKALGLGESDLSKVKVVEA